MNIEYMGNVGKFVMGVAILFIWTTGVFIIVVGCVLSKIYENRFFGAVLEVLKNSKTTLEEKVNSVKYIYGSYTRHRFGFINKKIIPLCEDLTLRLRNGKGLDSLDYKMKDEWAQRLESIIERLESEEKYTDERANEIVEILQEKVDSNILGTIQQKLTFLEAYHKGVLDSKTLEIETLKEKMNRKHWITVIGGILAVFGSIASIYSLF